MVILEKSIIAKALVALVLVGLLAGVYLAFVLRAPAEEATQAAAPPQPTQPTGGNVYYVSPNGSDSNPGTFEQPWASPGYASKQLKPGDTLVILGGRYVLSQYYDDMITPPSGTPDAWIVIKGEEGNTPVLAGRNNLLAAIDLSNVSYVKIENLEITSDNGALFREGVNALGGPVSNVILKDLHIHHVDEMGMDIADAQNLQIINCNIHHCGFGCIGGPAGSHGGWKNVVITGCTLSYSGHYYQGGPGPSPYDRPDGFGIEPSEGPIEISYTLVEHNRGDGIDSKAANTYVHHCVVANNFADGIKLWGDGSKIENCLVYGRGDGDPTITPWAAVVIDCETSGASFEIINVTVHDYLGGNYPVYVQYGSSVPISLTVRNTIIAGNDSPIYFEKCVSLTFDHNLVYIPNSDVQVIANGRTYSAAQLAELGASNIYGDPLFASPAWGAKGDYTLLPGSPAVDAGTSEGAPTTDLAGNTRPMGQGWDLGAYECA